MRIVACGREEERVAGGAEDGGQCQRWRRDRAETKKGGREVQTLTCTATLGTFKLTHGVATTLALAFDATATQVQTALAALSTIVSATVSFSTGAAACSGTGVGIRGI